MLISLDPGDGADVVIDGSAHELVELAIALVKASDRGGWTAKLTNGRGEMQTVLLRRTGPRERPGTAQ